MKSKEKPLVLQLGGGIGKAIMASSMIKWVNEKYPQRKITVISPWPEVFEYNPRVWRNLPMQQAYLFEDYIRGNDYRLGEPYNLEEYYRDEDKMHLMNVYPKAYRFEDYNEDPESEVYLNKGELKDSEVLKMQGPPVFTVQFTGGMPQGMQPKSPAEREDSNQRDMTPSMGQTVVNTLLKRGFRVIQVAQQHEPGLQGVQRFNLPFRRFMAMCPNIAGHIGIDSSMMHACGAFKTPQLIFFGQTHPDNLGYKYEGSFIKMKPKGGYYRPRPGMPDNAGIYPYRHKDEEVAMDWKPDEVATAVEEFIEWVIKNRIPEIYPNMHMQGHNHGPQKGEVKTKPDIKTEKETKDGKTSV